jgi:hypothetical protein
MCEVEDQSLKLISLPTENERCYRDGLQNIKKAIHKMVVTYKYW